jgi:hypothetical protein
MLAAQSIRIEYRDNPAQRAAVDALDNALTAVSEICEMHIIEPLDLVEALAPAFRDFFSRAEQRALSAAYESRRDPDAVENWNHTADVFASARSAIETFVIRYGRTA